MTKAHLTMYAVKQPGSDRWFAHWGRNHGFGPDKPSWSELTEAKLYTTPGPARAIVTRLKRSNTDSVCIALECWTARVLDPVDRAEKAAAKLNERAAKISEYQRQRELADAEAQSKRIEKQIERLRTGTR